MYRAIKTSKTIIDPQYNKNVTSFGRKKIIFSPPEPLDVSTDTGSYTSKSGKFSTIGNVGKVILDPISGRTTYKDYPCMAYDESIDIFQALEGAGYNTCHTLVSVEEDDYLCINYLSFSFYTRSKTLKESNPTVKLVDETSEELLPNSDPIECSYKVDYHQERNNFILENCPSNLILLIDGPFISGLKTDYMITLNNKLLKRDVIPIFIVKNSTSNIVIDNLEELNGKYNSDIHWANTYLCNGGMRTSFFKYTDSTNQSISKIFCYIKPFDNHSPQRVEFHEDTYKKYGNIIPEIMDMLYYFYLNQGPDNNVQVKPIIIAEQYAREMKKIVNVRKILLGSNIQATMNEMRGMYK